MPKLDFSSIRHSWVEGDEGMGKLVDVLFKWLMDDAQAVAIKVYAIAIFEKIITVVPDLKREMIVVLEEAIPNWESSALQYRGRIVIKKLRKVKRTYEGE